MDAPSPASPLTFSRSHRRMSPLSPPIQEEGMSTRRRSISHDWNTTSSNRRSDDQNNAELTPIHLSPRTSFASIHRGNRTRAASHDIILSMNDILPRYNNELAERIESITDEEVRSFSTTPDRRLLGFGRERANTCPRPRRRDGALAVSPLTVSPLNINTPGSWQDERLGSNSRERANTCPQETLDYDADLNRSEGENVPVDEIEQSGQESAALERELFSSPSHSAPTPAALPTTSPARRSSPTQPPPNSPIHTSAPATTVTLPHQPRPPCIYRHHTLLKALMLSSLYILLSYTWKNDLKFRYKSTEINAGLSEYWNGNEKLVGDDVDDVKDRLKEEAGEKKRRRPVLSHARSVDAGVLGQRRVQRTVVKDSEPWWSVSRMAWLVVWMGFALPVVELGWREVRRQYRLFSLRRMRLVRSSSSVHDL